MLIDPGLAGIVAAVKVGRVTFQRILTYTLNSIIKKIVTVLFPIVGLLMTGQAILTPLLMVILMIAGDFLAMSLTTDNVRPSPTPNVWRIGSLTIAGVAMGICPFIFCSGVLAVGKFELGLGIGALRSLSFILKAAVGAEFSFRLRAASIPGCVSLVSDAEERARDGL